MIDSFHYFTKWMCLCVIHNIIIQNCVWPNAEKTEGKRIGEVLMSLYLEEMTHESAYCNWKKYALSYQELFTVIIFNSPILNYFIFLITQSQNAWTHQLFIKAVFLPEWLLSVSFPLVFSSNLITFWSRIFKK